MKHRLVAHPVVRTFVRFGGACSLMLCFGISRAQGAETAPYRGPLAVPYSMSMAHKALSGSTFTLTSVRPRTFTPNGDNRNDHVAFVYENPSDALLTGKIYNLHGTLVAELTDGVLPNTLAWDGSMKNGVRATPGVYVYQIEATGSETKVVNGVVVVAR